MNAAPDTKSTAASAPCTSGHLVARRHESPWVGTRRRVASTPPQISRLTLRWFTWYSRRYLRRHFHSLRISHTGLPTENGECPLVIYANHASWWDPLVFLILKHEFFHNYSAFAPIESAMLERYQFFRRLGFFGVQRQTAGGALEFLRTAEAILQSRQNMLVITPQARFADIRERPLKFAPGLGHLATRLKHARFMPFAAEFIFWEERLPEILVRFGTPIDISSPKPPSNSTEWTQLFEQRLAENQDYLAEEVKRRNPKDFRIILKRTTGQSPVYDLWRLCKMSWRGEKFTREHGNK